MDPCGHRRACSLVGRSARRWGWEPRRAEGSAWLHHHCVHGVLGSKQIHMEAMASQERASFVPNELGAATFAMDDATASSSSPWIHAPSLRPLLLSTFTKKLVLDTGIGAAALPDVLSNVDVNAPTKCSTKCLSTNMGILASAHSTRAQSSRRLDPYPLHVELRVTDVCRPGHPPDQTTICSMNCPGVMVPCLPEL